MADWKWMALCPEEADRVCLKMLPPTLFLLQKSKELFFPCPLLQSICCKRERQRTNKCHSWVHVSLKQMNSKVVQVMRKVHLFLVQSQLLSTVYVGCGTQGSSWFCSVLPYLPLSRRSGRRCLCPTSLSADCVSLWTVEPVPGFLRNPSRITEYLELFCLMPGHAFNLPIPRVTRSHYAQS